MSKTGRIGNDCVCHKGLFCARIIVDTGSPTPVKHCRYHGLLLSDLAFAQRLHLRDQARVLDHEGHELSWVPANWIKLQPGLIDKAFKGIMGGDADPMTVLLQRHSKRDERLHITPTAHDLNDYVEFDGTRCGLCGTLIDVVGRRVVNVFLLQVDYLGERSRDLRFEVDIDASIGYQQDSNGYYD